MKLITSNLHKPKAFSNTFLIKFWVTLTICILSSYNIKGQVTIGQDTPPLPISVLEIISPESSPKGLRLPQLSASQITELEASIKSLPNEDQARANGLLVYNTSINCGMLWNGETFTSLCGSSQSKYTVDCSSATISGTQIIGTPLDLDINAVKITVTTTSPGTYAISMSGNGVTYSAEGTFISGSTATPFTQQITLKGSGTPIKDGVTQMPITNSLTGDVLCNIPVVSLFPKIKLLGLGEGVYQPASASATVGSAYTFLKDAPNSFGTLATSKVHIESIDLVNGAAPGGSTALQNLITTNNPDIIYIGYSYNPSTAAEVTVLTNYVNQGGVLIHASQNTSSYTVPNSIFGTTLFIANSSGTGSLHLIQDPTPGASDKDPVFYGPFSTANGLVDKRWGEDVRDGWTFTSYPTGDPNLVIYSWRPDDASRPSCIRHKTLGYMYIGDAGFIAGSNSNNDLATYPFKLDSTTKLPIDKTYTGGLASNSEFFGNIMAWAIRYAYDKKHGN